MAQAQQRALAALDPAQPKRSDALSALIYPDRGFRSSAGACSAAEAALRGLARAGLARRVVIPHAEHEHWGAVWGWLST